MSIKSGLFAGITTVVLILVLGNSWMRDRAADGDVAEVTRQSIVGQLQFQVWDQPSEIRTAMAVRLVLLVVLAVVFGAIVGRARPAAAFIGGWSAFLAAAVVSGGVYSLVVDDRYAGIGGEDTIDSFTTTAVFGAPIGMYLGWLVGLAVLLGSFGKGQPRVDTAPPGPAPAAWPPPADPYAPPVAAPFGAAGDPGPAPAPPPPPPAGGPVIGTPPDRTQVFGEPPARDT